MPVKEPLPVSGQWQFEVQMETFGAVFNAHGHVYTENVDRKHGAELRRRDHSLRSASSSGTYEGDTNFDAGDDDDDGTFLELVQSRGNGSGNQARIGASKALPSVALQPGISIYKRSGLRKQGDGVEEDEQEIVGVERLGNGGLQIRVTLLAAGFIIGAAGASVRELSQVTGVVVQSRSEPADKTPGSYRRPTRVFRIQGRKRAVQAAAEIIQEAVQRYRELNESKMRGEFVQRQQIIRGVEFSYQPPPRANNVPGGQGEGSMRNDSDSRRSRNDQFRTQDPRWVQVAPPAHGGGHASFAPMSVDGMPAFAGGPIGVGVPLYADYQGAGGPRAVHPQEGYGMPPPPTRGGAGGPWSGQGQGSVRTSVQQIQIEMQRLQQLIMLHQQQQMQDAAEGEQEHYRAGAQAGLGLGQAWQHAPDGPPGQGVEPPSAPPFAQYAPQPQRQAPQRHSAPGAGLFGYDTQVTAAARGRAIRALQQQPPPGALDSESLDLLSARSHLWGGSDRGGGDGSGDGGIRRESLNASEGSMSFGGQSHAAGGGRSFGPHSHAGSSAASGGSSFALDGSGNSGFGGAHPPAAFTGAGDSFSASGTSSGTAMSLADQSGAPGGVPRESRSGSGSDSPTEIPGAWSALSHPGASVGNPGPSRVPGSGRIGPGLGVSSGLRGITDRVGPAAHAGVSTGAEDDEEPAWAHSRPGDATGEPTGGMPTDGLGAQPKTAPTRPP